MKIISMTIKNILSSIDKITDNFILEKIKVNLLFVIVIISIHLEAQAGVIVTDSIQIGGTYRIYKLFLPSDYPNQVTYPLIINLHARCSNMDEHIGYSNMNAVADTAKFIVAYPLGLKDPNDPFNCLDWNDNGRHKWDDVAFISALIDKLIAENNVSADKVYSCGFSRGGALCYTLACELSNKIAAIAVISGGFSINPLINSKQYSCQSVTSKPVLIMHGDNDPDINYNGYPNYWPSIDTILSFWGSKNNCTQGFSTIQIPDNNTADNCSVTKYVYNSCPLTFYKITDGRHSWPGSQGTILIEIPPKNLDINASVEIWNFFKEQSSFTSVKEKEIPSDKISIFYNPGNNEINIMCPINDNTSIVISNVMGQILINTQNKNVIDISNLSKGLYFILVRQGNNSYSQKLYKQ
jgi:polyhydroxybutyrate depolymerase